MVDQSFCVDDIALAELIATLSTHYSFSTSGITVTTVSVTGNVYTVEVTFTGSGTLLLPVVLRLQTDGDMAEFQAQLNVQTNWATAVLVAGDYDLYLDCLGFFFFYEGSCDVAGDLDILFVVDSSSSITDAEFTSMKNWLSLVHTYSMPQGTTPAMMQFATGQKINYGLETFTLPADLASVLTVINDLRMIGGATFTSDAIDLAYDMMTSEVATSEDKVVVLLTDGEPTPGREPCDVATKLRDDEIKVIVIGVDSDWDLEGVACAAYNPDSSDPENEYIITVVDWLSLSSDLLDFNAVVCPEGVGSPYDGTFSQTGIKWNNRFVYESIESVMVFDGVNWNVVEDGTGTLISQDAGTGQAPVIVAIWNHYDNDGNFVEAYNAMRTTCFSGTTTTPTGFPTQSTTPIPSEQPVVIPTPRTTTPEPSKSPTADDCTHLKVYRYGSCDVPTEIDVIFVVDTSASLGEPGNPDDGLADMQAWLELVLRNFTARADVINTAMMHFGQTQEILWRLSDNYDVDQAIEAINNIDPLNLGGATYTKDAVQYAIETLIAESRSAQGLTQAVTIFITDGVPTDSYEPCTDELNMGDNLNSAGTTGIVVGVGAELDPTGDQADTVSCLATDGQYLYFEDTFTEDAPVLAGFDEDCVPGTLSMADIYEFS